MVLLVAGGAIATGLPVDVCGYTLSLLFFLATIVCVFWFIRRALEEPRHPWRATAIALLASVILLLDPYFVYWGLSGMENSLYSFVTMLALIAFQRGGRRTALAAAALLPLVRYDGVVPAAIIGFACVLQDFSGGGERTWGQFRRHFPRYALWGALTLVPFFGALFFRVLYYGDFVPHTAYEKFLVRGLDSRLVEGSVYVWNFLWASKTLVFIAIAVALRVISGNRLRPESWLVLALLATLLAHCVYVGGDVAWKPYYRFGHLPAVLGLLAPCLCLRGTGARTATISVLSITFLIAWCQPGPPPPEKRATQYTRAPIYSLALKPNFVLADLYKKTGDANAWRTACRSVTEACTDDDYTLTGKLIAALSRPEDRLITSAAGKLVYFAGLPTIDITSLASTQLWRELSDAERTQVAQSCQFASFHSSDGNQEPLLYPHTGLKPVAYIANTPYYYGMLSVVFSTRDDLTLPDTIPGPAPLRRFDLVIDGTSVAVYARAMRPEREIPWITDLYRKFRSRVLGH